MDEHLKLQNVTAGYGRTAIVRDVTLSVRRGRMTCILGSNGAGKTTLFRTITGIIPPLGGRMFLNGKPLEDYSRRDFAREVAAVLTARAELPDMTGFDVACMGRIPHTGFFGILSAQDREAARRSLAECGADGLAERLFSEMSDGEKQKVLIARGLCQDTGLLLLDEPTSHLDIRYKLELLESLRRQCVEGGRTILCTLHEPDLAVKCSDDLILMKGDSVLAAGPADEIVAGGYLDQLYGFSGRQFNAAAGLVEFPAASGSDYFLAGSGPETPGLMRALCRSRKGFGAGVLRQDGLAFHVAETMGAPVVSVPAGAEIPEVLWEDAFQLARRYPAAVAGAETVPAFLARLRKAGIRLLTPAECLAELDGSSEEALSVDAVPPSGETLIFGGTSEGRELAEFCRRERIPAVLSVATEYGEKLAADSCGEIHTGPMDRLQMEQFLRERKFSRVVDATHPHAKEATQNIRVACKAVGLPYVRLLREVGEQEVFDGVRYCRDATEAAGKLEKIPGNVLLTTGSKELAAFSGVSGFTERVYVRVLPLESSIRACRETGLSGSRILAEQGPFSKEWNLLTMREKQIRVLVTKDSGSRGGFPEKLAAARELGIAVLAIRRPQEEGVSLSEAESILLEGRERP